MKVKALVFLSLLSGCSSIPEVVCDVTSINKAKVMVNVWAEMDEHHSGHSEFCATDKPANQFDFYSSKGECRVYLPCGEQNAKGQTLLHGDWIVSFDSISSEVNKFYDVAW